MLLVTRLESVDELVSSVPMRVFRAMDTWLIDGKDKIQDRQMYEVFVGARMVLVPDTMK